MGNEPYKINIDDKYKDLCYSCEKRRVCIIKKKFVDFWTEIDATREFPEFGYYIHICEDFIEKKSD